MSATKPKVGLDRSKTGRRKGTPNKTTAILKDAILKAAEDAGNGDMVEYLKCQAIAHPGAFLGLLGKVLPLQVSGPDEGPIEVRHHDNREVAKAILHVFQKAKIEAARKQERRSRDDG